MRFGINQEQLQLLEGLVINPLKRQGARVYLFGSRARGNHHPHSDVDLMYAVSKPVPAGFISQIKEEIESSRFPFTVDLVNETDLAESYRSGIQSERIEI